MKVKEMVEKEEIIRALKEEGIPVFTTVGYDGARRPATTAAWYDDVVRALKKHFPDEYANRQFTLWRTVDGRVIIGFEP